MKSILIGVAGGFLVFALLCGALLLLASKVPTGRDFVASKQILDEFIEIARSNHIEPGQVLSSPEHGATVFLIHTVTLRTPEARLLQAIADDISRRHTNRPIRIDFAPIDTRIVR